MKSLKLALKVIFQYNNRDNFISRIIKAVIEDRIYIINVTVIDDRIQ